MLRNLTIILAALLIAVAAHAQSSRPQFEVASVKPYEESCCRLKVATSTPNPGELILTVTVTNLQEIPVNVRRTRPEWDIRVKIVSSGGIGGTAELTPYGQQVLGERWGSAQKIDLKNGEMFSQTLDLGKNVCVEDGILLSHSRTRCVYRGSPNEGLPVL